MKTTKQWAEHVFGVFYTNSEEAIIMWVKSVLEL